MDFIANSLRGVKSKPAEEDAEAVKAKAEKELLDSLYNNFNIFFDTLELTEAVKGVDYIELIRALSSNTTVKNVVVERAFLAQLVSGDEIRILLEIIAGLPKLEHLTIHFVPELAITCQTIADVLRRTKTLVELHFFDLELAGDDYDMEPLSEAIEALKGVTKISFNQLGIVEIQEDDRDSMTPDQIINALINLPALEEVSISSRRDDLAWDEECLGGLCESKTLKVLKVNNIELDSSQIAAVAGSLSDNTTLQHLELSKCGVDEALASFLPENTTLRTLNLTCSPALDDGALFVIGSCMEDNSSLKVLQLQNEGSSEVTSQGIGTLCRMLEKNKSLECIEVSFTSTEDAGFEAVANALRKNNTLKQLYIENHATGVSTKGVMSIGKALETNSSLEKIGIVFDGEDSNGVLALAQAMQKSPSLKHFAFNNAEYHSANKAAPRPSIMGGGILPFSE